MKKNNWGSPIGLALTVAGVVLALSPEARRGVSRLVARGTSGVLNSALQVRERNSRDDSSLGDNGPQES